MRTLDKHCYSKQAKGADKLELKSKVAGTGAEVSPVMSIDATGEKREPNPFNGRINGTR